jgi:hypothetical protein
MRTKLILGVQFLALLMVIAVQKAQAAISVYYAYHSTMGQQDNDCSYNDNYDASVPASILLQNYDHPPSYAETQITRSGNSDFVFLDYNFVVHSQIGENAMSAGAESYGMDSFTISEPTNYELTAGGTGETYYLYLSDVFNDFLSGSYSLRGSGTLAPGDYSIYYDANLGGNTDATGHVSLSLGAAIPEPTTVIIWSLLGTLAITIGSWRRRKMV